MEQIVERYNSARNDADYVLGLSGEHQTQFACNEPYDELFKLVPHKIRDRYKSLDSYKKRAILINKGGKVWDKFATTIMLHHFPQVGKLQSPEDVVYLFNKAILEASHPGSRSKFTQKLLDTLDVICSQKRMIDYTTFIVFGCPMSTDIDVVVVTDDLKALHHDVPMDRLRSELADLGYDVSREIDVGVIYIHDRKIADFSRGWIDTHNVVISTWKYHKQPFTECPIDGFVETQTADRIRGLAKYILDNYKYLVPEETYYYYRLEKQMAYAGEWTRVDWVLERWSDLNFVPYDKKTHTVLKSMCMKLIQTILNDDGQYEYSKKELARKIEAYFPSYTGSVEQGCLWYLTRGKMGTYDPDIMTMLFKEFVRLAEKHEPEEVEWNELAVPLNKNPTELADVIFEEFVRSPHEPSATFVTEYSKVCPTQEISGSVFKIRCHNGDLLPQRLYDDHIYLVDQRSPEWHKLLTYHKCGRNCGVEPYDGDDWIPFYYNLIRGCIAELMIIWNCDFSVVFPESQVDKITVGMMTPRKQQGSLGISPDLLLRVDDQIIPVEIKCIMGPPADNSNVRSKIKLAKLELQSSMQILNVDQGVIVVFYIYEGEGGDWVYHAKFCIYKSS